MYWQINIYINNKIIYTILCTNNNMLPMWLSIVLFLIFNYFIIYWYIVYLYTKLYWKIIYIMLLIHQFMIFLMIKKIYLYIIEMVSLLRYAKRLLYLIIKLVLQTCENILLFQIQSIIVNFLNLLMFIYLIKSYIIWFYSFPCIYYKHLII